MKIKQQIGLEIWDGRITIIAFDARMGWEGTEFFYGTLMQGCAGEMYPEFLFCGDDIFLELGCHTLNLILFGVKGQENMSAFSSSPRSDERETLSKIMNEL